MKPHEETWEEDSYGKVIVWVAGNPGKGSIAVATFHGREAEERAKLAAQAPAMARFILANARYPKPYAGPPMHTEDCPALTEGPCGCDHGRAMLRVAGVIE